MTSWGVYLHSPFCPYKCTYCDFDAGFLPARRQGAYVDALCREIRGTALRHIGSEDRVDTVYFGGGTPSLFSAEDLEAILSSLWNEVASIEGIEITIETIPEAIDAAKASALGRLGFNRVSVGAETFDERQLRLLGRTHTADSIDEAFGMLRRAGHRNTNLDLIVGLPGQTMAEWQYNLDRTFRIRPEHISMYVLELHEKTRLARDVKKGRMSLPEDELVAEMYQTLQARTTAEGYEQYEISNFALPGFKSAHNLKYWSDQPYLGFGSSAHSYDRSERWCNVSTPSRYVAAVKQRGDAVAKRWTVDAKSRLQESLFLGLRRTEGVDLGGVEEEFGEDPEKLFGAEIQELVANDLLERQGRRLRLTPQGMLLSNEVFVRFV